jgi:Holliday junction resolvase RusA-like endonuclease
MFGPRDKQVTEILLPWPPSTNNLWRYASGRKPYPSDDYKMWKRNADSIYQAYSRQWVPIKGRFNAELTFNQKHRNRSDIDNRIKPCLDWLQRVGLIENDKLCSSLNAVWGEVEGVRIQLSQA